MRKMFVLFAAMIALVFSAPAMAQQETFAYNGTVAGSFNGNPFTTTLILTGDATTDGSGNPILANTTATTPQTGLFDLGTLNVSFTQNSNSFLFDTLTFQGSGLDLTFGNFGTPTGMGLDNFSLPGSILGGSFDLQGNQISINGGNGIITFTTPAVPEPATWAMMLLGFGAIGFAVRSRGQRRGLSQLA